MAVYPVPQPPRFVVQPPWVLRLTAEPVVLTCREVVRGRGGRHRGTYPDPRTPPPSRAFGMPLIVAASAPDAARLVHGHGGRHRGTYPDPRTPGPSRAFGVSVAGAAGTGSGPLIGTNRLLGGGLMGHDRLLGG